MRNIFLVADIALLPALKSCGFDAYSLDAVENAPIQGCELTVVALGLDAKALALELKSRGVADVRLNYVDLQRGDDVCKRALAPKHLHWDDVRTLAEAEDEADFPVYESGFGFLDKNMGWGWRLPELDVVAGAYSSGKSTFLQMLAAGFVHGAGRELGSGALLCSWEDIGSEIKRNFQAFGRRVGATDMLDRVSFVSRNPDDDRLVEWFVDLVEYHLKRYNTRYYVLDPWNEMDHVKDVRQSETDYVRDMMKTLRHLVNKSKIILQIATHVPARMIKGDGAIEPFKIAHSFGSVQFGNKADRGLCVVRTKKIEPIHGHMIVRLDKSKIERRMGRKSTVALRFNECNFSLEYDADATAQVQDVWKD